MLRRIHGFVCTSSTTDLHRKRSKPVMTVSDIERLFACFCFASRNIDRCYIQGTTKCFVTCADCDLITGTFWALISLSRTDWFSAASVPWGCPRYFDVDLFSFIATRHSPPRTNCFLM